jgi:hypothetical protein
MKKTLVSLSIVIAVLAPATTTEARLEHHTPTTLPRMSERRKFQLSKKFVERLAWCETHGNWKNGGNWAGGLGIARSTWGNFGGREFARTPDRATKEEQIIVANRVALWGYTKKSGSFKYPVGLSGWGGLRCALPIRLVRRRIDDSLAFSRHETGDPYRETQRR